MDHWIPALQATALCLSLLWLLLAVASRPRSPLGIVWALFCASMAMAMARWLVGEEAPLWHQLLGVGACLTCNGFWLVARALFREGRPFGTPHLAYAGIVAILIIATRQAGLLPDAFIVVGNELLQLLSSVVLVLAFREGLRGWRRQHGQERSMRLLFLATYGGSVGACFILPAMLDPDGTRGVHALASAGAAASILLLTQGLVAWRLRHPLHVAARDEVTVASQAGPATPVRTQLPAATTPDGATRGEDEALAALLERHMRLEKPYLQADLKLGQLAQAMDVSEYRISRAVRGALGQRNISQYINGYRLAHARRLLADPALAHWSTLVVALESGFGSLNAFHRAFKAAEGCTPGDYRAIRLLPHPA